MLNYFPKIMSKMLASSYLILPKHIDVLDVTICLLFTFSNGWGAIKL